jgi:Skp family chaperone for outer membrane proteins
MKRSLLAAVVSGSILAAMVLIAGCNKDGGAAIPGGGSNVTGVVNLDKVASDLGLIDQLNKNLEAYKAVLQEDIKKHTKSYDEQVSALLKTMVHKDSFKPDEKITLDAVQSQQLSGAVSNARQAIGQLQQMANNALQQYRAKWITEFRNAYQPVVRGVAQDKKVSVVLLQTPDTVIYADHSVDVTDAVVDSARAHMPTIVEVQMPHLPEPQSILPQTPASAPATQPAATQP